jgi:hypothetical protein
MTVYATTAQIKAALSIGTADTASDTQIGAAGTAASAMIDAYCGRTFGTAVTATRYYAADNWWVVRTDDFIGTATVETDEGSDGSWVTWATTDVQAEPLNNIANGVTTPYNTVRAIGDYNFPPGPEALVRVTATFGRTAIPDAVSYATILLAERLYKRVDSPLGVAGFGDMGAIRVSRYMDPDVELLLAPHRTGGNSIGGIA